MRFLAVTDLHYTNKLLGDGDRRHSLSLRKLQKAVTQSIEGCDCIVNLGDTAEGFAGFRPQGELLDEVYDVLCGSGLPNYSIIGNHDTHMRKQDFYAHLGMTDRCYTFDCGAYRCIVLDACLNDVNNPLPKQEIEWDNCWIDPPQIEWLRAQLDSAPGEVLIFTHVPFILDDPQIENPHLIKNRWEVMEILKSSGRVKAVFSGHYHNGCFGVCDGIPYITFAAMVVSEENNYAVVDVTNEGIVVRGFGLQQSWQFQC